MFQWMFSETPIFHAMIWSHSTETPHFKVDVSGSREIYVYKYIYIYYISLLIYVYI